MNKMIDFKSIVTPFPTIENNWNNIIIVTVVSIAFSSILFLVLHVLAGTVSKKFLSFKNINTFKKILIYQVLGLIISSCFIPLYFFVARTFSESSILDINESQKDEIVLYIISMQVIVFMTASIFLSYWLMIGIIPSYISANFLYLVSYKNQFTESILYLFVFFILSFLFCWICNIFLKRNKKNSLFFIILPILGLVFFIIVRFIGVLLVRDSKFDISMIFVNIVDNWLLFLVLITFGSFIQKVLDSTSQLKESILYDNEIFVNNGYSKKAFENYIKTNNIKTGAFITFEFQSTTDIYTENRQISNLLLKQFKEFLEDKYKLKNKVNQDKVFLFKTKWNEYGIFYEIDKSKIDLKTSYKNNFLEYRSENDCFKEVEKTYKKWFKSITYNNNKYDFKTFCFLSIYGIHSTQFDKLVHYNQNLKKNLLHNDYKNIVNVFNYSDESDIANKIDFVEIKNQYGLDKAYISLDEIKTKDISNKKNVSLLIPSVIWIEQKIYTFDDIYKRIKDPNATTLILRNIALRTLKLAKHAHEQGNVKINKIPIVINYPIIEFAKRSFSIKKLINKIDELKIDKSKLIFNFSFLSFSFENFEIFFDNLKILKKQKILFSFSSLDQKFSNEEKYFEIISENFKNFYPNYIFVDKKCFDSEIIKNKFKKSSILEID